MCRQSGMRMIRLTSSAVQFSPSQSDAPPGWSLRLYGGTIQVTAPRYPWVRSLGSQPSGRTWRAYALDSPDRLDRVVGHPAVAVAVLGRPVLAPRDAAAVELAADRVDRKARRDVHELAVADHRHRQVRRPVAAPVLDAEVGAVDRAGRRRRHRVEVVGEARRVTGRERVVEQLVVLRPAPVGRKLARVMRSCRRASWVCRSCPASPRSRSSRRRRCRSPRRDGCAGDRSGRREPGERDDAAVGGPAGARPVAAGEEAEQVVVGAVLLDDEDDVADRRARAVDDRRAARRRLPTVATTRPGSTELRAPIRTARTAAAARTLQTIRCTPRDATGRAAGASARPAHRCGRASGSADA